MKRHFESFEEFVSAAEIEPSTELGRMCSLRSSHSAVSGASTWRGTSTWSQAVQLARYGWDEGRAIVEGYRVAVSHLVGSKTRRAVTSHCVMGFAADVGAFCSGDPENMFSREYVDADAIGKTVKIVFNGTASGAFSANDLMQKGACCVALIDAIESAGIRCEVVLAFASDCKGERTEQSVTVKRLNEPVEIDRLAFALAHPATYRRFAFSCWEQDSDFIAKNHSGYGRCVDASDKGDVYIGFSDSSMIYNPAAWAKSQLAALGITFED